MKVLMIGADPSFRGDIARFEKKFQIYADHGHSLSFIDMLNGVSSIILDGKFKFYCFGGKNKALTLLNNFIGIWKIYRTGEKFDIVTSQDLIYTGLLGLFAAKLFKVELVPQVHGDYVDNPLWLKQSRLRVLENKICRFVLSRVTHVRTVSNRVSKDLEKYTQGKKVISSPIGSNLKSYIPPAVFPEKRNKQILFVGRLIEEKNPLLFCEIAKKLLAKDPEFKVHFAGRGIMQKELEQFFLTNNIQDKVTFSVEYAPDEKYRQFYWESLCYLHTALWEGWGMPMVESSASGCPVFTTDSGCAGEAIIDGVNGYILPADADVWVDKILAFDKDVDTQRKMSEEGAKMALSWSVESQTKKFIDFLYEASKK